MRTVEEYLSHAAKADELASMTNDAIHKAQMAKISQMWRELAEQRRRLLESENSKLP